MATEKYIQNYILFGQAKGFACAEKFVNPDQATSFDEKKTKEKP